MATQTLLLLPPRSCSHRSIGSPKSLLLYGPAGASAWDGLQERRACEVCGFALEPCRHTLHSQRPGTAAAKWQVPGCPPRARAMACALAWCSSHRRPHAPPSPHDGCRRAQPPRRRHAQVTGMMRRGRRCILRGYTRAQTLWGPGIVRGARKGRPQASRRPWRRPSRQATQNIPLAVCQMIMTLPCHDNRPRA